MIIHNAQLREQVQVKSKEFGISEEVITIALFILYQNKEFVNAMDNRSQMDEYIYRAVIKKATERRKHQATLQLEHPDEEKLVEAEKDLSVLSKEELTTDPYYRAILPVISKVVATEPILRLHAEEAADIVLKFADFKRRFRATSVTEIFVTKCRSELSGLNEGDIEMNENEYPAFTTI